MIDISKFFIHSDIFTKSGHANMKQKEKNSDIL